MRRSHQELKQGVMRSLEAYLRTVGPEALGWYVDQEGDWQELDALGWEHIWRELRERNGLILKLSDTPSDAGQYGFEYYGKSLDSPLFVNNPGAVCAISFWLPPAYLEKHGPTHIREMALELANPLPFNSGHASLAFNFLYMPPGLRSLCFRYPGMDVQLLRDIAWNIGTRVRGAYWLTFLGQPVLGELGGVAGLRARLSSPDITIQEMEGARAVITLGTWPEAGDTEQGHDLPLYRELARVLKPWLYQSLPTQDSVADEELRRWERRFLD